MLEVFATVCLLSSEGGCKDIKLSFMDENITVQQCIIQAQPELAKWIGEHPGWRVAKFGCRPKKEEADL